MKKRTTALTLVLIGPTLIAGCSSSRGCDPNTEGCSTGRAGGYYGGGYYGGGGRSGGSSVGESGGFGSTGRGFSGGG